MSDYRHGVSIQRSSKTTPPPVRLRSVSAVGVVGTAYSGPVGAERISSLGEGLATYGESGGTLPDALRAIFAQALVPVVAVNVFDSDPDSPGSDLTAVADEDVTDAAGSAKLAHARVAASSLVLTNAAQDTTYVAGTDFELDPLTGAITRIATSASTYAEGASLKADYKWADLSAVVSGDLIGVDADGTGLWALPGAETAAGLRPDVICAPGWRDATVKAALGLVGNRLGATVVADGPGTTEAAAFAEAALLDSQRMLLVDPDVLVDPGDGTGPVKRPPSGYVAGAISANDAENGYWDSPSNRPIKGIIGVSRATDTLPGGAGDRLGAKNVATIVRGRSGFKLWGGRVVGADSARTGPERFLSVRRIMDRLELALLENFEWAIDRNISQDFLDNVAGAVQAHMRALQAPDIGALLDGDCQPAGANVNTDESLADGDVYFNFEILPAIQAERIGFIVSVRSDYSAALLGVEG